MAKKTSRDKEETKTVDSTKLNQVSREDLLPMQLAWKEMENAALKQQVVQMQVEKAAAAVEASKSVVNDLNITLNSKYGLDVQKDRINIETGEITRA